MGVFLWPYTPVEGCMGESTYEAALTPDPYGRAVRFCPEGVVNPIHPKKSSVKLPLPGRILRGSELNGTPVGQSET